MLWMVIENFRNGDFRAVGERFARHGRMLPDEVSYRAGWVQEDGARCFQLIEAPSAAALALWMEGWSDLIDFEVVPVFSSPQFWSLNPVRPA